MTISALTTIVIADDNDPFVDERLPRNFVPFNVQSIGNDIVVTYVLHLPGSPFETDGPGLGYVDIYSSTGQLLRRLEHGHGSMLRGVSRLLRLILDASVTIC